MALYHSPDYQINWDFWFRSSKYRFSRKLPWRPSWISDWNHFSYFFYLQVTLMLPTKFGVNWPFGSGEDGSHVGVSISDLLVAWCFLSRQLTFHFRRNSNRSWQSWWPLGFPIGIILAIDYLQVTPMLPTKFQINWPFGSGEVKKRFSRWPSQQSILGLQIFKLIIIPT